MVTASGARGEVSMLCPLSSYLREVSHHSHPVTPPSRFKRQLTSVVLRPEEGEGFSPLSPHLTTQLTPALKDY